MKRVILLFVFSAFYLLVGWGKPRSVENEIQNVMRRFQAIGVSAVVVKDNEICYSHVFGYNPDFNDTTLRKPIPDDGIYWVASVSKTFVSTAIMQLVEENKLELDDDVNKYLQFSVRNPLYQDVPITVRMLLCHRSSINDKHYGWNLNQINPKKSDKWKECYDDEKPGSRFSYCNLNYNLLGAIIEKVANMRFDEYIDKNICEILGLKASFNLLKIDSSRIVRSCVYDNVRKQYKPSRRIYDHQYVRNVLSDYHLGESAANLSPAGGMKISAIDLAKWMMVHMNYGTLDGEKIISKESELQMWQPQGKDRKYGFAFSRYPNIIDNYELYGMKGGSHGINSTLVFNPDEKYGFIIICNGHMSKKRGRSLNDTIIRVLYKHFIAEQ